MKYGKVVFITGVSSGIGLATAMLLKDHGYHVYGGSSRAEPQTIVGKNGGFIKVFTLNVSDEHCIEAVFAEIKNVESSIDILINNAGIGIAAALEDFTQEEMKKQIDVNLFGSIRMIQTVLPAMREQKNGLIINITSVAGVIPMPFQSLYSVSKAAMNMLSDTLRLELKPFNVKSVAVAPGDTKTNFTKARIMGSKAINTPYSEKLHRAIEWQSHDEQKGYSADKVAKTILKVMNKKRPRHRYTVGFSYKAVDFLKKILPNALLEYILIKKYLTKSVSKTKNK